MKTPREYKYCLIKVPKQRAKYEVYIFDTRLAAMLDRAGLSFLAEDLEQPLELRRKMLFKSLAYAKIVARIVVKIGDIWLSEPDFDFSAWLSKQARNLRNQLGSSPSETELASYFEKMNA